jgi:hypothetical protein
MLRFAAGGGKAGCCQAIDGSPRGWTAVQKPITGKIWIVDLTNQEYNHKQGEICGPYDKKKGRYPVRISSQDEEEGNVVMIRPKCIALQGSLAAVARPKTTAEVNQHWNKVETEGGRLSEADAERIKNSPPCSGAKCAGACWRRPGIHGPVHIEDMMNKGVFDFGNHVLDFFEMPGKQPYPNIRPRTVEEDGCALASLSPLSGVPCIYLGKDGCTLPRDLMPVNCKGVSCDDDYNVDVSTHSTNAANIWLTPEGEQVVRRFQQEILRRNPRAPITQDYYHFHAIRLALEPNLQFEHMMTCSRLTDMITMATEKMMQMRLSPDPQILHIILEQMRRREPYLSGMERELLAMLKKGMDGLSKALLRCASK